MFIKKGMLGVPNSLLVLGEKKVLVIHGRSIYSFCL